MFALVRRLPTGAQTNVHAMTAKSLKARFMWRAVELSVVPYVEGKPFRAIVGMSEMILMDDGCPNPVAGGLASRLPHHRQCGSASGGIWKINGTR